MRKWQRLFLTFILGLSTGLQAQIVVVVDDNSANDAAYVDGVGGNLSGSSAVKDAVNAVNTDPNTGNFEIRIIDTNGVADTYVGDFLLLKANTTIHQTANGSGNDAAVTLQGDGSSPSHPTSCFLLQADNCVLSGLSAAKPMVVTRNGDGAGILTGSVASNLTWQNLSYVGIGGEALDHNDWANGATNQHFIACTFRVGNGPQISINTVFDNCDMAGGGFKMVIFNCTVVANNCNLAYPSAGGLHFGGAGAQNNVTFNNCSFKTGDAQWGARLVWSAVVGDGVYTFNNPTFNGYLGDIIFDAGANCTINVNGSPTNKVNLNTALCVLFFRGNGAKLNLKDVSKTDGRYAAGFHDCANGTPLARDVAITMERCIFKNGGGDFNMVSDAAEVSPYGCIFTATNCYWGGTPGGNILDFYNGGTQTGPNTVKLTHCTMTGPTANTIIDGNPSQGDTLTGNYCIFDVQATPPGAASGVWPLSGVGNLDFGYNPAAGGAFWPGVPGDTIHADPKLDENGHLTAGSAALAAAIGSTQADDLDGDARPLVGTVSDIGADEANLPNPTPKDWPISVFKAATPPTIDGVVNVSTEYANSHVVDLRLSTLAAMDPYWPDIQHDGSNFQATGTTTDDADLSALIYFLWDSQAMYVAVVGSDEQINPFDNPCVQYACSEDGVNRGDTFQLCLDYDQKNAADGQLEGTNVYIPSWALTDNANDANWFQQFWPVTNPNPFTGITYNMKTNATGYVLETRIPWTAFTAGGDVYTKPFPPVNGQTCGALPMLEDNDDGLVAFMYTAGKNGNIIVNAGQYHDLIFWDSVTDVEDWTQY